MEQLSLLPRSRRLLACERALKSDPWLARVLVVAPPLSIAMAKTSCLCASLAVLTIRKS
uniref:Uncharacterized protein n=1 Tax=Physcomitrium patens TaxID=3218 RepID=A0A2K1KHK2_PHYPA|nr:hypothetical protein PHYPA_009621 [Physcomitrium patens]